MKKIIFGFASILMMLTLSGCASSDKEIVYEDEPNNITK